MMDLEKKRLEIYILLKVYQEWLNSDACIFFFRYHYISWCNALQIDGSILSSSERIYLKIIEEVILEIVLF